MHSQLPLPGRADAAIVPRTSSPAEPVPGKPIRASAAATKLVASTYPRPNFAEQADAGHSSSAEDQAEGAAETQVRKRPNRLRDFADPMAGSTPTTRRYKQSVAANRRRPTRGRRHQSRPCSARLQ